MDNEDSLMIKNLAIETNEPKLLYNDYKNGKKISYELNQMILNCDSFDFSVAFISESGLAALKQALVDFESKNSYARVITSTYLSFNNPKIFRELLKFKNIEVRIFEDENYCGFHPKGYIFKRNNQFQIIVGSSNITDSALATNQEWNLCLNSHEDEDIVLQVKSEFDWQWKNSFLLTEEWVQEYEKSYEVPKSRLRKLYYKEIQPNYMQQMALESLKNIRVENKDKALLISATGTGKTYLSAFDVKSFNPPKMLFVVHRKSIALKAMETFQNIIKDKSMGMFSGDQKELDKDYIFSTIQTIHKPEYRKLFKENEFEYIIIDEVHKAGAGSYQELMNYFKPKFLLGMSATPERGDDFDIYKMFDYNIAFEIRLQQAMEYNLLCPFHYYGITDLIIDDDEIDDKSNFNTLVSDVRVNYIIDKINKYGFSGDKVHGLIFCSRKQEAITLSSMFNERGYSTLALTGDDCEEKRQEAMDKLESNNSDSLDYIFTVDIFNEGIDIPKVNQVIMLRPTESSIVFVQQLGRGLRKDDSKDYVVIIDFIGNYEKNFLIPVALSGSLSYNKDTLRRFVSEGTLIIPGTSSIQFDEISKNKIYEAIDHANFNDVKIIKESYYELKKKIGRIPSLNDFVKYNSIDPQRIFQNKSLGSYYTFLKKYEKEYIVSFSKLEEDYLKFVSIKLASGKRVQELEAIKVIIENRENLFSILKTRLKDNYNIDIPQVGVETIKNILQQNFITGSAKSTFKDIIFMDDDLTRARQFNKLLLNNYEFKTQILEVINYAIDIYNRDYIERYRDTDFCLYKKYTYDDVCRLLNWDKSLVALNIGGYYFDKRTNTLPVFINYHKDEDISESINYEDHFIDQKTLIAMSKNNRRVNDTSMNMFHKAKENNTHIHLFVRKNKDDKESKEFYYLGLMSVSRILQKSMPGGAPICEIIYNLDCPVKKDIYDYISDC